MFPFVVGMNHEVQTKRQLRGLLSHRGNVREGSNLLTRPWQAKDDDMIGNMAETGIDSEKYLGYALCQACCL